MHQRPVRRAVEPPDRAESVAGLLARLEAAAAEFGAFARNIVDAGQLDAVWNDYLDTPPRPKTYGGAIAHVLTYNMHHHAQLLYMLDQLGVPDMIEGDYPFFFMSKQ